MQRNDVRTAVKLVERHVFDLHLRGVFRIGEDVVSQHLHAEPLEYPDQLTGDLAGADDARRLAVHVEPHQAVQREIPVARAPVGTVDFAVERQHQRHGMFRDGMGRIGRNAHDGDAVFGRGLQVYVVEAGATQCDQFHAHRGQLAYRAGVGRVVDEDADRVGPLRQQGVVAVQVAAVVIELEPAGRIGAVERLAVVGLGSEECYFHKCTFFLFYRTENGFARPVIMRS